MPFIFEKLEVYIKAIEFTTKIHKYCVYLRKTQNRIIADQLQRASLSIPLNIAEGNGRIHNKEKKQYFYVARGSLLECVPILYICLNLSLISKSEYEVLYKLAEEISKMLSGLIRSINQ
jgi:four helix bundle protein